MKSYKLLIIGGFPGSSKKIYGGIARSCQLILDSSSFDDFKIIKLDSSQISHPPQNIFIKSLRAFFRIINYLFILTTKQPNVILIFCSDGASAIEKGVMTLIARLFKIKSIIFPRAGNLIKQVKKSNLFLSLISVLFNRADVFLCQGKKWEDFALTSLNLDKKRVKIISNWTATLDLLKVGATRDNHKKKDKIKLLFVGWLEKEKGIMEIIRTFNNLIKKDYSIHLTLIGDGRIKKEAIEYVKRNNLSKNVLFKGWMESDKILEYYKNSDIFLLPSWQEGMPNALIEALACKLATVTTSVGMIPDYLTHNKSSLIIKPKDEGALNSALEKLITNSASREMISNEGYLIAKEYFSTEKSLNKLAIIIKETLN